jgi:hypothetical protein
MPISDIKKTYLYPIPSWKGPLENGVPEVLVVIEPEPPIPSISGSELPFWCSQTQAFDAGITGGNKISGSTFDDQE